MSKAESQKSIQQNNSSTKEIKPKPAVFSKKLNFSFKLLFIFIVTLIISFIIIVSNKGILGILPKNYLGLFSDFVFTPTRKVQTTNDRINVLILGKSGEGYTAPDLTDSMMMASVSLKNPSIRIISIPRDLWIAEIRAKINSAYYWGKQKDGNGIILSRNLLEKILDMPIHYSVVFDFSSFTKIIDILGGIEIDVERSFTDEKYPIAGRENDLCDGDKTYKCRYETISFEEGIQLMDGQTALKFVRSRNAKGDEGTDIAREERQQKVILAAKNKVLSIDTILNPEKIMAIWQLLRETVETDFDESSVAIFARKVLDARADIKSSVIPSEFLINPPLSSKYDYQYVFITKNGWEDINNWVIEYLK